MLAALSVPCPPPHSPLLPLQFRQAIFKLVRRMLGGGAVAGLGAVWLARAELSASRAAPLLIRCSSPIHCCECRSSRHGSRWRAQRSALAGAAAPPLMRSFRR